MNKKELLESRLNLCNRKPEDIPLGAQERVKRYRNFPAVEVNNNLLKDFAARNQANGDRSSK